jgi:chromate reductase, NAD(P)H dehydrogenase (quinone)
MKVLAISGSTRKQSSNNAILRIISERFSERAAFEIYDRIDELPHFNPDLDQTPFPEKVTEFRTLIAQADAILICTPEYVFSLPGSLKNALEWLVSTTVLSYKSAAFIVASASGKMAFESLGLILETLLQEPVPADCSLLIQGSRGKIDTDGRIADTATLESIDRLIETLLEKHPAA